MSNRSRGIPVNDLDVSAFTIPTSSPEADGTLSWNQTTIVVVTAEAGGLRSLGYTYAGISTAQLIDGVLKPIVLRQNSLLTGQIWMAMRRAVRNLGHPGICSMAIAAVDNSLWDLKARLCGTPLFALLGGARSRVAVYGSGGFTSYSILQLEAQLRAWVAEGIRTVKMKVGSRPEEDVSRVCAARKAIGPDIGLMVDANGAYSRKQAVRKAFEFRDLDVTWFEEPVSSDDLEGLRLVRDQGPPGMEIAAGEYGYDAVYFRRMLQSGAVDVLQADATRCAGITGFLQADALCQGFSLPLSAHTAPSLHGHLCCAAAGARDVEYFHDHVRIEKIVFDGALQAEEGMLQPDPHSPGLGLVLKTQDVERYRVYGNADSRRSAGARPPEAASRR
ncbi:MAG TPA: enolase C-terminal domain-like protein [Candidatus Acidoferrales bacterium]|nr:enolase C-terminal domain-like protein [Candidatus Acidoferrales bacterium]